MLFTLTIWCESAACHGEWASIDLDTDDYHDEAADVLDKAIHVGWELVGEQPARAICPFCWNHAGPDGCLDPNAFGSLVKPTLGLHA